MLDCRSAAVVVDALGLRQVGDDGALREWIAGARAAHPLEFERYDAGEKKLKGVLIKYVMEQSGRRGAGLSFFARWSAT